MSRKQNSAQTESPADAPAAPVEIFYIKAAAFPEFLASAPGGRWLGVVAHGLSGFRTAVCPVARVNTPQLGGDLLLEVWRSPVPVLRGESGGIRHASNGEVLFGALNLSTGRDAPGAAAQAAYARIFAFCRKRGYPHPVRIWNYFPRINQLSTAGMERYREFCSGRFIGLRAATNRRLPAASALGSRSGGLAVHFLAAKQPGLPLENPRQLSAWRYPVRYGSCSPSFSRAQLLFGAGGPQLFISGTASIVNHESRHSGNPAAQLRETERNLRALLRVAQERANAFLRPRLFKIYLRDPADYPLIREQFANGLGHGVPTLYLQADICRQELLLEIDAYATAYATAREFNRKKPRPVRARERESGAGNAEKG